jgi:hypothetical protein
MKFFRWPAAATLTLISLMDIGTALPGGGSSAAVRVLAPLLGALGLVAVYGLLRRHHWGTPAALAAGAVNVVSALIGLVGSSDGADIGLAVSAVALVLTIVATSRQASQPHSQAADPSS